MSFLYLLPDGRQTALPTHRTAQAVELNETASSKLTVNGAGFGLGGSIVEPSNITVHGQQSSEVWCCDEFKAACSHSHITVVLC